MILFTTAEAAVYLRLKERKLYELVAEQAIPCTKVTGKWLFPKHELDNWLREGLSKSNGASPSDPLPIVGGSHDPLLEWALRESGSHLAALSEGTEAGLTRFAAGEIVATALHLHASEEGDANKDAFERRYGFFDSVLVAFAQREQGILVGPQNPLQISSISDLVSKSPRILMRQKGAGAQLLLEALLAKADYRLSDLKTSDTPCSTGNDLALAIRAGRGDCGIATRSVATAFGLGFIPLLWERFDIAVRQAEYFKNPFQHLVLFLRSENFAARAQELGGYDISDAGTIRAAP
jgi:putative molybdopterin biosynthesis protein